MRSNVLIMQLQDYTDTNKGTLEFTNGYSLYPYISTLMGTLEIDFVESSVPFTVYNVPIPVKQFFR